MILEKNIFTAFTAFVAPDVNFPHESCGTLTLKAVKTLKTFFPNIPLANPQHWCVDHNKGNGRKNGYKRKNQKENVIE